MKTASFIIGTLLFGSITLQSAPQKKDRSDLAIVHDPANGQVTLTWSGKKDLKEIKNGKPRKLRGVSSPYIIEPVEDEAALFQVESANAGIVSQNVVGYVNKQFRPGLSLVANPLFYTNNSLAFWMPVAPDGAQVYKYSDGGVYEVSTFDANEQRWSNPDLQVPIGTGFFFNNPSAETFLVTFVGEVLQGVLVNHLPAGHSSKGPLVPMEFSINSTDSGNHGLPGSPGDELRIFYNDGLGGGDYIVSTFVEGAGWVPDQRLAVGEGFWITKSQAQDWIWEFWIFR